MVRIFRETNEFACEECGLIDDLPYKVIDGKKVCDKCYEEINDRVEAQLERHLNGEF